MICKYCGAENPNDVQFCSNCGCSISEPNVVGGNTGNLPNGIAAMSFVGNTGNLPNGMATMDSVGNVATNQNYQFSTGANGFVNENEKWSYSLRNGWMQNVVSGEGFIKEDAVLTNKRLYYSAKVGLISKSSREEIVEIKDITGTKIFNFKPYGLLCFAALLLIASFILMDNEVLFWSLMPSSVFFIIAFFIAKKSHLRIEYAGGCIHFSVKKYGLKKVREFQRQIYTEKERLDNPTV